MNAFTTIDEYIAGFEEPIKSKLMQIRSIIHEAAPTSLEVISYNMPAFKSRKVLVYFAAARKHIGFYPTGEGIEAFREELSQQGYKFSKGAVQFPLNQELPVELIHRMVRHRLTLCS